jgi:HEAT repeat protein
MRQRRKTRYYFTLALTVTALALARAGKLWSAPDPVEELRQALAVRPDDRIKRSKEFLDYREKILGERVKALRTISDLRRAFVDWKIPEDRFEALQKLDQKWRGVVGNRLTAALTEAAKSPDVNVRLAVANLIAELGPGVPGLKSTDPGGFARSLTGIVIDLARDPAVPVRRQGLRALGMINPDLDKAIDVLGDVLKTAKDVGLRRTAAESLRGMVRVVANLNKKSPAKSVEVWASPEELILTCKDVVDKIAKVSKDRSGIRDRDIDVRTICLEAVHESGAAFSDLPGAYKKEEFPPAGRKLTEDELARIGQEYARVRKEIESLEPLLQAMAGQGAALRESARDAHPRVKSAAAATLEELSHVRLRLQQRVESLPALETAPKPVVTKDFDKMVVSSWPVMAALLKDPSSDLDVRRRAIEFLENLADDGVPALDAMIKALGDHNRFIRWAAARTIGNLPVEKAATAVPYMTALIDDNDLDVRQAVVRGLERLGAHARPALEALQNKILDKRSDPEFRIAVMYCLASIGPEDTVPAIPLLIRALPDPDARVRRTAAEILGKYGRLAESAVPALREALGDDDMDVRRYASDALLSILIRPAKE